MRWCDIWGIGYFSLTCNNVELEPSTSLVSLLSSSGNYSNFLREIQRSDLVDYLNELGNVTLLAPQNIAYDNIELEKLKKKDLDAMIIDHPIWEEAVSGTMLFDSLLKSINDNGKELDTHVPILMKKSGDNQTWFIENALVIDDQYSATTNSKLLGIDSFLIDPKLPLCSYFTYSLGRDTAPREFRKFAQLVSAFDTCNDLNLLNGNLTVLIPSDISKDMTMFNEIEWNYLTSLESSYDRNMYLGNYFINGMIGGNLNSAVVKSYDLNGESINISSKYTGDAMVLEFNHGQSKVVSNQANYILNDGILHYFEDDIFPNTDRYQLEFTPRKYLIGLDQNNFVREIDFENLNSLIDDKTLKQTIFISSESQIDINNQMKNRVLYHFADKFSIDDEHPEILLNSFNCKTDNCQKIRISKQNDGKLLINDNSLTIQDKIEIGSTSIYLIDEDIELPSEFKVAIAKRKIGYARSANLIGNLKLKGDKTVFLPHTGIWEELGLVWKFLKSNPEKLQSILKSLIFNDRIYTDFEGAIETTNGLGEKVVVQSFDSHLRLIYHQDKYFEIEVPISWDNEIIFDNGVIHALPAPAHHDLKHELFPWSPTFNVSLTDILSTQNHVEFSRILEKLGLNDILDPKQGYSILLPPGKSLVKSSLLTWDENKLREFISLHVLPKGSIRKLLDCIPDDLIPTIDPKLNLQCRELSGGELMLSIAEGADHEVRILQSGLTFPYQNQGVLILDKFMNPEWLDSSTGIHVHLSWLALFVGFLLGIIVVLFSLCACLGAMVSHKSDNNESNIHSDLENGNVIIERAPLVTVNEQMPLLGNENPSRPSSSKSLGLTKNITISNSDETEEERTFSSEYSKHAKSHPVRIGSVIREN